MSEALAATALPRETALHEQLSSLARVSAVIALEAHSPLVAIKASLRALRADGVSAELVREVATDINRAVARLDRIVGDVLDFARPLRPELAPADVAALVWDAAETVLQGWEGPHLRVALEPDLGAIVTDANRLRGVLEGLLANARESLRSAGRSCDVDGIEIGARRVASCRLVLWVSDRGAGVAADDLPHVFEPFFTGGRTGTGLAIARKVVEALGGTIRMDSREGAGTRVEIDLPATPAARLTPH